MFDVITIGGITRDIFFEIDELELTRDRECRSEINLEVPYGTKIVADSTYYSYGGGAFNVSVALRRLGLKTAAVAALGKEGTGSLAAKILRKNGVATNLITRTAKYHTGLSVFLIGPGGDHTAVLERGANNHLVITKFSVLKKTRWLYVSSLTGESAKYLPQIFNYAQKNNLRIAFNPGSEQLKLGYAGLKDYFAATDLLLLNREEATKIIKSQTQREPQNINELLKKVENLGTTFTVITDGEKGCYALFEGRDYHQTSFQVSAADTTGAGDAFGATFLYSIIKGYDIAYGLKIAAVNSASVVSKMGATEGLLTYNGIKSSKWL